MRKQRPIDVNIQVLAMEDDSKWRTVLASLYEHGHIMSSILIKHLYESLLERVQVHSCSREVEMLPCQWDFPQLRSVGEEIAPTAQVSCLFGLEMTSARDEVVQEVVRLIMASTSDSVAHHVILTTFLNHEAVQAILKAFEA